jgi:hypothetical protein
LSVEAIDILHKEKEPGLWKEEEEIIEKKMFFVSVEAIDILYMEKEQGL